MKKKLLIIILLLATIISISAVSASELVTKNNLTTSESDIYSDLNNLENTINSQNIVPNDKIDEGTNGDEFNIITANFSTLKQEINKSYSEGKELILTKDYTYDPITDENYNGNYKIDYGSETIVIDGQGHAINAKKNTVIEGYGIILKNLIVNEGYFVGDDIKLDNVTFINTESPIFSDAAQAIIKNSKFINCSSILTMDQMPSAENTIFINCTPLIGTNIQSDINFKKCTLINCTFPYFWEIRDVNFRKCLLIDCNLKSFTGGIYDSNISNTFINVYYEDNTYPYDERNIEIDNTILTNTQIYGPENDIMKIKNTQAINVTVSGHSITIDNSKFINNSMIRGLGVNLRNSSFINNNRGQNNGGIINGKTVYAINSTFINNTAQNDGGAIYTDIGIILSSTFINNTAQNDGGAVYISEFTPIPWFENQGFKLLDDSIFENNVAFNKGGAMYINRAYNPNFTYSVNNCKFINNKAQTGGALYFTNITTGNIFNSIFENNKADSKSVIFDLNEENKSSIIRLNGYESYINAIYSKIDINFKNVTYWMGKLVNSDDLTPIKSEGCLGQEVHVEIYDSWNKLVINNTFITDNQGAILINYSDVSSYRIYHLENEYYAYIENATILKNNSSITINNSINNGVASFIISLTPNATGNITLIIDKEYTIMINNTPGNFIYSIKGIKNGCYDVIAIYNGDANFMKSKTSTLLFVNKLDPTIFINTNIVNDNTLEITPVLPSDATGNIILVINDKIYTMKSNEKIIIPELPNGEYVIVTMYEGDDIYNNVNNITSCFINKSKLTCKINISQISIAGNNVLFIVDVNKEATGLVKFEITGEENHTIYTEIINGQGILKYTLMDGNYQMTATYTGNSIFNSNTTSKEFIIDNYITVVIDGKEYSTKVVNGTAVVTTDPVTNITVVVDGKEYTADVINGTPTVNTDPVDTNITVVVDGVSYPAEVVNGTAVVKTNGTTPEFNITVVVDGVSYPAEVVNGTAVVKTNYTQPIVLKSSEFNEITISDDLTISMVLKGEDGNVITNAPITHTVNGKAGTTTTDNDGKFIIKGENSAVITVKYAGNENITGVETTLKLNNAVAPSVVKIASLFDIDNRAITINGYAVDTPAGEEGIYYATTLLDANGKPLSNVYIEFAVNNKIYNRTTYENGSFAPYKLNMVRAGRYTVAFNFAGDDNYTNAFACVCMDLEKKPITIKANNKTFKKSAKTKKYTVTLSTIVGSSHDGKTYLSPKSVQLTVNGKTYTKMTNAQGKVTFKITNLNKKGKYTANISFKGDKTYEEANKSVKITIK